MTSPRTVPTLESLRSRFDVIVQEVVRNGRTWRLARPKSADDLIDEEAFQRDGRIPYWADVWTSSRVLADELHKRPAGRGRLLELGCGVGFSSLVAAGLGYETVATDYYAEALEFVEVNAELNGLTTLSTSLLDWRAPPAELGTFDVVTAADVLYERPNVPLVAAMFDRFMKLDGVGYCTDPQRGAASGFADDCRKLGLKVNCFIRSVEDEGKSREIDFYVIKR
ncbi:MAG: methyltransferase domain-containing protein [Planctomycetaceae bacterium]|nr:methyltransferase domain-containing protein [Planctomycetaceae bacterium]